MATTINQPLQEPENTQENALTALLSRSITINWYVIAFTVILLLAIFTRFFALGERVMSHDESLHTQYSYGLYTDGQFDHTPLMHGPILFHFTALSYFLFGDNDFTSRIYTAVLGVLIVMTPLLFRRWLGTWGTIIASTLLLASPLMTYYSRYIRHDMPSILSAILMIWAAMMYISGPDNQKRRAHWLYIIAAAMVWNLGSKETAFIYIAIFGFFLTVYWLVRVAQHFYNIPGKPVFQYITIGLLLSLVFTLLMILVISIGLGNTSVVGGETLTARLDFIGDQLGVLLSGDPVTTDFATFLSWTGLTFVFMFFVSVGTALWAYKRDGANTISPVDVLLLTVLVLLTWVLSGIASLAVGIIVSLSLGLVYGAFRLRPALSFSRQFLIVFALSVTFGSGFLLFEELSHEPSRTGGEEVMAQPVPGEATETVMVESSFTMMPIVLAWVVAGAIIGALLYAQRKGWWALLDHFPEFDVLMVMGSLILPWLTAFIIYATNPDSTAYADIAASLPEVFRNLIPTGVIDPSQELARVGRVVVGTLAWIPMMSVAVIAGLLWNWRRWLISAVIFHVIFAFFFTTIFTNIEGLATGMIYSLEYWLEQQGVRRGSQPQYYYLLVILPLYEFLPIIGSVLAMFGGMVIFWRQRRERQEAQIAEAVSTDESAVEDSAPSESNTPYDTDVPAISARPPVDPRWRLDAVPFTLMVGWWALANLFAYTLSGEKMPWLGTHMTVPMIFLTAWYFGRIIDRVDLRTMLEKRGWVYLFVLPLGMVVLFQMIAPFLGGQAPFQGTTRLEQTWTYQWLGVMLLGGLVAYAIIWLVRFTGWRHLRQMIAVTALVVLSVVTFRSAWMASFINYDLATEFLVYAHGAPGNRIVHDTLQDLSLRTTGGMDIRFGYDDGMSWPGSWYYRDFSNALFYHSNPTLRQLEDVVAVTVRDDGRAEVEPLLGDNFQRFDYMRMWWPMQDYFNLNAGRMNALLDFSDAAAAERRRGIFDIWWARDYDRYAESIGRPGYFNLTNWPVSDQVSIYIRRDIAAQVWQYGIGGGTALNPLTEVQENVCATNWQPLEASLVFDRTRSLMIRPTGLDVTDSGLVYVAEEGNTQTGANMRISVFDSDGNYIESFGQRGGAEITGAAFERPHSVEIGANGNIYVVDTWNYLIRVFNDQYEQINVWGQPFSFGIEAPVEPRNGFWGPRDIAIDNDGNVYISDTGNKRVRVYDAAGNYLRDIGTGGSGPGQLDEPTGVAVHPDGRVFVADTWNRRVAVFTTNGDFLYNFDVRGWAGEPINRPYIAIDANRDMVYVGDPDAGRVLVHNTAGDCLGSFGQLNTEAPSNGQFAAIGGIDVDSEGFVYITDIGTGRVLRFDPFPPPPPTANEGAESVDGANEDVPAAQEDVNNNNGVNQAESTVELSFPNDEDEETAESESTEETSAEDSAG